MRERGIGQATFTAALWSPAFERFAGTCAVLAGVSGFLYAVAFIIISRASPVTGGLLSALFLMLGGILSTAALVAVYGRVRETDPAFALWALLLSLGGAAGSAVHGGYDLANAIHPPGSAASVADLPSQVDPRGLLTFGFVAIGLFVLSWLMRRGGQFPAGLGYLGYVLGLLFVILYLGRLIIVDATHPVIVAAAVLSGFLANPAWYIWLGLSLLRGNRT